jgi:hypothetical protein
LAKSCGYAPGLIGSARMAAGGSYPIPSPELMSPTAKSLSGPKPIYRKAVSTKFISCWRIGACGGQRWLFPGMASPPTP